MPEAHSPPVFYYLWVIVSCGLIDQCYIRMKTFKVRPGSLFFAGTSLVGQPDIPLPTTSGDCLGVPVGFSMIGWLGSPVKSVLLSKVTVHRKCIQGVYHVTCSGRGLGECGRCAVGLS